MFWFRPKALRKLFAHPWKWTDFNAEPHHVDGGLAHVLERLICYVAQDARYTTQQILSSHLASWNFAMLEYKLQKLSAAIPNADFSSQAHFLEEWKQAGYRSTHIAQSARLPEQVLSVRQAFGELVVSSKWSIAHRLPVIAKIMRPIYRAMRRMKSGSSRKS
jgi:lipopolysaccharide biosynthesis protein